MIVKLLGSTDKEVLYTCPVDTKAKVEILLYAKTFTELTLYCTSKADVQLADETDLMFTDTMQKQSYFKIPMTLHLTAGQKLVSYKMQGICNASVSVEEIAIVGG